MRRSKWIQVLAVVGVIAFASAGIAQDVATEPTDPRLNQGPKPEAIGEKVMVATQLPQVSNVAIQVLKDGGNAVDAMVAAVFMQHVNDFHQVSHFGSMSVIGYDAATDKYWALNAVSERPPADRHEHGTPRRSPSVASCAVSKRSPNATEAAPWSGRATFSRPSPRRRKALS